MGASDTDGIEEVSRRFLRPLFYAQTLALALVVSLLVLLAWTLVHPSSGAGLVAAIKRGDRPAAPMFELPLIWNRPKTWPQRVRRPSPTVACLSLS